MRVMDIIAGTTVDGPGFRTAIYFAGCDHRCPGCHNPSTWPLDAGQETGVDELLAVIDDNDFDVTLTGGDPLYQAGELLPFALEIRRRGKTMWLYTGFIYEQAVTNPDMAALIRAVDVVVDGPFVESLKDEGLIFRGSSNQRVIDVAASEAAGRVVTIDVDDVTVRFD